MSLMQEMDVIVEKIKKIAYQRSDGSFELHVIKPLKPKVTPAIEPTIERRKEKVTRITIYYREEVK